MLLEPLEVLGLLELLWLLEVLGLLEVLRLREMFWLFQGLFVLLYVSGLLDLQLW